MPAFGPKLRVRDRNRLSVAAGKGIKRKLPDGSYLVMDTDPAMLALLDGMVDVVREVLDTAKVPDAPPIGEGLIERGGIYAMAFGKAIATGGEDVKKPRGYRATRCGVDVLGGFTYPARFNEIGTVNQPARPFLAPAVVAVVTSSNLSSTIGRRFS